VIVDVIQKARWHLDLNNGLIPVLEFPDSTLINESRIIIDLANDLGGDKG